MSQDPADLPDPDHPEDGPDATASAPDDQGGERISKRLSRAGLCSRRDAERWIAEGRVSVNGRVLDTPAVTVRPGDRIVVDGQPVPEPEPTRVWRYHKPDGLVTTARDEKGRPTVFDNLPPELPRVVSVGRLDLTSEGLLLLTNDGALARHLELPATGWLRRYRVRVHGAPDEAQIAKLAQGIIVEGVEYGPIETVVDRSVGANTWLTVSLREGRNREVRRVMEHLGLPVSRLIRVAYGPFQLGKLEPGQVEEVPRRVLRDQLPGFFTADDAAAADGRPAAGPVRMRYDRLPRAARDAAPPSATKGGRGPERDAGGREESRRDPRAKPSARAARESVQRILGGSRPPERERPAGRPRPEERAALRAEGRSEGRDRDFRRQDDTRQDGESRRSAAPRGPRRPGGFRDRPEAAPGGEEARQPGAGIRLRSTRRTRPGYETERREREAERRQQDRTQAGPDRAPRGPDERRFTERSEGRGGRGDFQEQRRERGPGGASRGGPDRGPRGFGDDRARGDRPGGDRPRGDRSGRDRPGGDRPGGDRPGRPRPGGPGGKGADRRR
ncbi:pseudouridine synthase [Rhodocista pekingensis]|uniref:Pseudouridine synthase n=1 Tax=Rhodocista pekingensis TaxID=201185 RepID=A0ABW2L1B6_9PROT